MGIRIPGAERFRGACPAPVASIGQSWSRHGPGGGRPVQVGSGAMAAGRTTIPLSRTGFSSTTSVCGPSPSPRSSPLASLETAGVTTPCHVTRTVRSGGESDPSASRALWSPAMTPSAATAPANAVASARPSAGSSHRPGRRVARAATRLSGATIARMAAVVSVSGLVACGSALAPSPARRTRTSSTTAPTGCASRRRTSSRNPRPGRSSAEPSSRR